MKILIEINKKTKAIRLFGSVKALCDNNLTIKHNTLYHHFGTKKQMIYESEFYKVMKKNLIKSKRKN